MFEGSIQPGDILTFDGGGVNVKKMGIRSTLVRKPDGTEILIPNAKLFTSQVIKRTGTDDYVRATIKIRASYKQDPTKVIAILEKIGQSHPKVSSTPKPPKAFMEDFGEYGIVYRLHVWVDHRVIDPIGIKWNINMRIYEAFREHGIEIPVPQMNVQLNSLSPLSLVEPDAVPIE